MAFRKLFFKRVQGIRDNYVLQEGDIALDEDDFKLYRGDGTTVGGIVISGAGGGGGIALTDISVTQASASGAGTLAYNSSTGVITYTPPTASGLGALTSVAFADVTSKPTTIAGYGITDAFDGAYGSLSGTPTIPSALTDLGISDGTNGQVLTTDGSGGFTFEDSSGGGGSSLQSRTTKDGVTGFLIDGNQASVDITGFKGYVLLKVYTSRAARVRIYTDDASRAADQDRAEGTDPTADAGVVAEVITTTANETVLISPGAFGFNNESTPTTTIPTMITNKSGSTQVITVTLTLLQLES